MATRARERLLNVAAELFYAEGIRAVGVERLLTESGVGRASFYRHFESKDELVLAMFRSYDEEYRTWLCARVAELGGRPLDVFDAVAERAERSQFRGCAFLNSMAEFPDPRHPVHRLGVEHKHAVRRFLDELLARAGYRAHQRLAHRLLILLDGATATASYERSSQAVAEARAAAESMLQAAEA